MNKLLTTLLRRARAAYYALRIHTARGDLHYLLLQRDELPSMIEEARRELAALQAMSGPDAVIEDYRDLVDGEADALAQPEAAEVHVEWNAAHTLILRVTLRDADGTLVQTLAEARPTPLEEALEALNTLAPAPVPQRPVPEPPCPPANIFMRIAETQDKAKDAAEFLVDRARAQGLVR